MRRADLLSLLTLAAPNTDFHIWQQLAIGNQAAGNHLVLGSAEDTLHFQFTHCLLSHRVRQEVAHDILGVINQLINNLVQLHRHVGAVGQLAHHPR